MCHHWPRSPRFNNQVQKQRGLDQLCVRQVGDSQGLKGAQELSRKRTIFPCDGRRTQNEVQCGSRAPGHRQTAGARNGKSGEQAGAGSLGCGEEEQQSSRPEAKAAAIVLMSSRKWWEFVKGAPRALEFQKGSKVTLLLALTQEKLQRPERLSRRGQGHFSALCLGDPEQVPPGPQHRRRTGLKVRGYLGQRQARAAGQQQQWKGAYGQAFSQLAVGGGGQWRWTGQKGVLGSVHPAQTFQLEAQIWRPFQVLVFQGGEGALQAMTRPSGRERQQ